MKIANVEIKDIQKVQLEVLLEFDRICKKNNIRYQLFAGTLLGCIRHEGFIPWDDDIDVCMLREDYDKFIDLCKSELSPMYFLQTYETDKNYIMQFAKIRKNNTIFMEKATSKCKIHQGVYIDIFPLDKVQPNSLLGKLQQKILYILGRLNLTRIKDICLNIDNEFEKKIGLVLNKIVNLLPKSIINNLQNRVCTMLNNKVNIEYVSHLTNGASSIRLKKYMINKNEFYNIIEGKFEGYEFPIPQNYDRVLSNLFGDYMKLPPKESRQPHHNVIKVELNNVEKIY